MSLFESRHSSGEVSLRALLDGERQMGRDNGITVPELMERIVIGGWPDLLDTDENSARRWLRGYLEQIVEVDIPEFVGRRDPRTLMRVLASLGRYVGQSPAITAVAADAGGDRGPVSATTMTSHLDALERLRLLDNSDAWQPHMRSRTRLRAKPTRYFVDPSLGIAALGVTSRDLLNDLNAAGFHFEALCVRDLRVYAHMVEGQVETWRDESGNEVDAIVTVPGGQWAAIEIKMNPADTDKAAANLLRFAERVDTGKHGEPSALIVVTSTGAAGCREDGVHVVPITALGP